MARRYPNRRYSSRQYSSYSGKSAEGYERARQHIEDARRLSRELGGTDVDVKKYFFSLTPSQLDEILTEYGERFGSEPEEYARKTMLSWKVGAVKMSGTVAERLFKLLPPRMPLRNKYELTESLWSHFGPRSKKRLRIGLTADVRLAFIEIDRHIEAVVTEHHIPKEMEARFEWLAQGDVNVKQQLLNHLRSQERKLVSDGARLQLPLMLDHLRSDAGPLTHRITQILKIGNHELELHIDREFDGVSLEEWSPPQVPLRKEKSSYGWIIWILVIAAAIFILNQ